jgi:hypothetical protein
VLYDLLFLFALSSDSFETREISSRYLESRGKDIVKILRIGRRSNDIEVAWRCNELYLKLVEELLDEYKPLPMLDALWFNPNAGYLEEPYNANFSLEYRRNFDKYIHYWNQSLELPCPYNSFSHPLYVDKWWRFYLATELMVRDVLEKGNSDEIDKLPTMLKEMHRRDAIFYGGEELVPYHRRPK